MLKRDAARRSTRPNSTMALKKIGESASVNWFAIALAMV